MIKNNEHNVYRNENERLNSILAQQDVTLRIEKMFKNAMEEFRVLLKTFKEK